MKLEKKDGKYVNLFKFICCKEFLIQAYNNIRGGGSMTQDEGINEKYFDQLVNDLRTERFQFTSVKIPKAAAKGKHRPLSIQTSKDKLVQEAIRILLEVIYEGKFSDLSHGFRPKRSCHTAFNQITK